jgi:hypothetical protein
VEDAAAGEGDGAMRCVYCLIGSLRRARLTHLFTYGRMVYPLVDPDGLLCDRCGEAFMSQRAAAALICAEYTQRLQTSPGATTKATCVGAE